ncbi:hypothetical protein SAMN05443270_1490 [Lacrimispora sphenoides]|uniref:DUF4760 domain-containing protein n=1 Tax=Lacrimispora sphenoides TaxID=29370 RepID=UPI0008B941D9|nr:hypothetical protein [Lacrimispora sphenoides]SET80301.1 hypothetical protein SAMN05443270_1490 [Lacrimispora sphenoides]
MKKAAIVLILLFLFKCTILNPIITNSEIMLGIFNKSNSDLIKTWIELISNIFTTFGVLFAAYEYWKQKKLLRIANAVEIANQFSKEVVDLISYTMISLSADEEIKNIIDNKIKAVENARHFNLEELNNLFNKNEINKYLKLIGGPIDKGRLQKDIFIETKRDIILHTLNRIEHFSMSFNSKLADDKVVYQSLHQALFTLIPYSYIFISSINVNNVDKYYCNTCELYGRWIKVRNRLIRKEERYNRWGKRIKEFMNKRSVIKTPTT